MAGEAIFICYRREDTADVAGRMYDALASHFGRDHVFKDVDSLRPGADFGAYIKDTLPRCRVALIMIGPNWVRASDDQGRRRLDDPRDWVRVEVETALSIDGLDVVPVLVNGASLPRSEDLPPSLGPLLERHAALLRRDPDFHNDVGRLAAALDTSVRTGTLDLAGVNHKRRSSASALRSGVQLNVRSILIVAGVVAALALSMWQPWRQGAQEAAASSSAAQVAAELNGRWRIETQTDCRDQYEVRVSGNELVLVGPDGAEQRETISRLEQGWLQTSGSNDTSSFFQLRGAMLAYRYGEIGDELGEVRFRRCE